MAFGTELVGRMSRGPEAEVVTAVLTTPSANDSTLSVDVPPGEWHVFVGSRTAAYGYNGKAYIYIDGGLVFTSDRDASVDPMTARRLDVSGGRSVNIRFRNIRNKIFDVYLVRIA